MLCSDAEDEANAAYWALDNHIVLQGQLFEAAPAATSFLLAGLSSNQYSEFGLRRALDLLVEIAFGEADYTEVERANVDLGPRCRALVREQIEWFLQLVATTDDDPVLLGVIDLIDRVEVRGPIRNQLMAVVRSRATGAEVQERLEEFAETDPNL